MGVDAIIAESRVAKATLYSHFKTKDELIVTVLGERSRRWFDELGRAAGPPGRDPLRRLMRVFDRLVAEIDRDDFRGSASLNAIVEFPEADHPVRRECVAEQQRLHGMITSLVRDAGLARPDAVASKLLMVFHGAVCARLLAGHPRAAAHARAAARTIVTDASRSSAS